MLFIICRTFLFYKNCFLFVLIIQVLGDIVIAQDIKREQDETMVSQTM